MLYITSTQSAVLLTCLLPVWAAMMGTARLQVGTMS